MFPKFLCQGALPPPGTCRRRCQVALNCRSVTIVPLSDGAGGVECRVSPHPKDPARVDLRPRLGRMPGALHILETGAFLVITSLFHFCDEHNKSDYMIP